MNSPLRFGVPVLVLAGMLGAWGCVAAGRPPVVAPGETAPLVALALGGGGARGFAEVGVLRVLEQEKIPVGLVVGTSVGSLIGALYADTGSVLDLEFEAVEVSEEDIFDYRAFSIFSGGFVKGERLERFLNEKLRHRKIEEFPVRFAAVAVELTTGKAAIFDRGPAAKAVHASCAIPGVFVPVEIDGKTYVDGGVTEPIPVEVARRLGAQVVIAVAIPAEVLPEVPRNPVALVYQAVSIMSAEIARLKSREADVVIWPEVGGVRYDDFSQKKRLMEAGAAATRAAMPAIREAIRDRTASPAGRP